MKTKFSVLTLTALLVLGLGITSALGTNVTYLGKTTWTATITDDTDPTKIGATFTVTGGVSKVGGEFYMFQGYVTPDTDGPFVISGSGFLMGNTLVFTASESQQHTIETWRDSGVMHISIDKTTLNGTFYDIGTDYNPSGKTFGNHRNTAGNLTRSGTPIPLSAANVPAQLLLLQK